MALGPKINPARAAINDSYYDKGVIIPSVQWRGHSRGGHSAGFMRDNILEIFTCPDCSAGAPLSLSVDQREGNDVWAGTLTCPGCARSFPVIRGIPRFVTAAENYGENFAYEWTRWGRVQIDRFAGHNLSTRRFVADTRWPESWLKGKLILDAGCGAGRFADVAATFGARVIAVDLSGAVEAARENTPGNVEVIQASLLRLPFRRGVFDGIYCFGVIQHTPDPPKIMSELPSFLKPGGQLAYNFYEADWWPRLQPIKYALRRFTPSLSHAALHRLSLLLTILFFPLSWVLRHIRFVRIINVMLPICAVHNRELTIRQQFLWTMLDTFDWYSPRYEIRQVHSTVADILRRSGLMDVESVPGLAWGRRPE